MEVEAAAEGGARAARSGARAAAASLVEGVRYILNHPLLPGLYALDWGLTLFTFYRELVRPDRPPTARAHSLTAPCTHPCRALACPRLTPHRPSSADPPPRMTTCLPHASHSAPPVSPTRQPLRPTSSAVPRPCAVADYPPSVRGG